MSHGGVQGGSGLSGLKNSINMYIALLWARLLCRRGSSPSPLSLCWRSPPCHVWMTGNLHLEVLWKSDKTVSILLAILDPLQFVYHLNGSTKDAIIPPSTHPSILTTFYRGPILISWISDMATANPPTAGPRGRLLSNWQVCPVHRQHRWGKLRQGIQHPASPLLPLPKPLGPSTIKQMVQENATRVCKTFLPQVVRPLNTLGVLIANL